MFRYIFNEFNSIYRGLDFLPGQYPTFRKTVQLLATRSSSWISQSLQRLQLSQDGRDCTSASQTVSRLMSLVEKLHTAGDIYCNRRIVTERPEEDILALSQ